MATNRNAQHPETRRWYFCWYLSIQKTQKQAFKHLSRHLMNDALGEFCRTPKLHVIAKTQLSAHST